MWLNLAVIIYNAGIKPFESRKLNYTELYNEVCVCIVTGHDLFFTDLMPTRKDQFKVGWSMIAFMIVNALCNISVVFKLLVWNIYLIILKWYRRLRKCIDKNYKQPDPDVEINERIAYLRRQVDETKKKAPNASASSAQMPKDELKVHKKNRSNSNLSSSRKEKSVKGILKKTGKK